MDSMDFIHKLSIEVVYVLIAALGGVTRYLQFYLNEGQFAWRHFCAHTLISSFSGYMFYQFGSNVIGLPDSSIAVVAGLGGWMGVESLKFLEGILKKKLK